MRCAGRVDDLTQVVGWDVGGHPHGDATTPVDQEVREPRRQDRGLLRLAVVGLGEIDCLLVDALEHRHGDLLEPALGVVADEAVGEERMRFGIDPQAVDRALAGVGDALYVGEEVVAGDERSDHPLDLLGCDPTEDST